MKREHIQEIIVVSPFYPPHIGGLQTHAAEFNHHLSQCGYRLTVLTSRLPVTALPIESVNPHITVIRFPVWEIIGNYPLPAFWQPAFWRLVTHLPVSKPKLVISRTRFFVSSFIAFLLAIKNKSPLLHIEHGSDFVPLSNSLLRRLARFYDLSIGKFLLQRAALVVANSNATKKFVELLSGRQDIKVIYRGIDQTALQSVTADTTLREKYPNKILVTYIGRIIDGKGLPVLLRAFSAMPNSNFHCIIIGDGPALPAIRLLAHKLNLDRTITFIHEQPWTQAMAYLKGSDIYVNPSYAEGLPTGVIEAAMLGRCIIATSVGGTPEIIIHNASGLLVTAGAVNELVAALKQTKDAQLRAKLGRCATLTVAGRFNWQQSIEQYDAIIRSL